MSRWVILLSSKLKDTNHFTFIAPNFVVIFKEGKADKEFSFSSLATEILPLSEFVSILSISPSCKFKITTPLAIFISDEFNNL